MNQPTISQELQSFIRTNPKISEVYFDKAGRHYFNVHKLRAHKNDTDEDNWKNYGSGLYSHQQVIPGIFNVDQKKETISRGNPDTEIVYTMSRQDILNAEVKRSGDSLAVNMANATDAEKALMLESLLPKDLMNILKDISSGKVKVVKADDEEPVI